MEVMALVGELLRLIVGIVGKEKAAELLSQAAIDSANAEADAIEALRFRYTDPA